MPYTGNEKVKPKCPICNKEMTFVMTDPKSKLGGYTCNACDDLGKTNKTIAVGGR